MAVGVGKCGLGFADAAQTRDRLGQHRWARAADEQLAQFLESLLAANEIGISGRQVMNSQGGPGSWCWKGRLRRCLTWKLRASLWLRAVACVERPLRSLKEQALGVGFGTSGKVKKGKVGEEAEIAGRAYLDRNDAILTTDRITGHGHPGFGAGVFGA